VEIGGYAAQAMKSKIGIFLPGLNGDIMSAMSVLKYRDILWPDKDIVWFCNMPMADALKFNIVSEIRPWPNGWCGWGKEQGVVLQEDWNVLKTETNHLNQDLKQQFELTHDLDEGYFPAPWMMSVEQRHGIDYPNISRKVFGADPSWEWHPYLCFSQEEIDMVRDWCLTLPHSKTVMLETYLSSGPRWLSDDMTHETMRLCRERFGKCNFIFASKVDIAKFQDDVGIVSCPHFTVRQTALVNNHSDLFVSIGSGISVATSCWGNKVIPKIQYTGSFIGSTVSLANGPIEAIYHDHRVPAAEQEYYQKLRQILANM
jgi:hypothetical protein